MLGRLLVMLGLSLAAALRGQEVAPRGGATALTTTRYVENLLIEAAQTLLVVLAAWMLLAAAVSWLRAAPGLVGRAAHLGWHLLVPVAFRAGVCAVVGAQVLALPAVALDETAAGSAPTTSGYAAVPSVERPFTTVPARPVPARPVANGPALGGHAPGDQATTVVVRRGDTLWAIAEQHLNSPTSAEVAAEWPRWYRQNRTAIGSDPDVIVVGTVLRAPSPDVAPTGGELS